ncbi:hypothetical protein EXIGLDRAFT_614223 [Exidia glandulosa HHB12029]|uniref:F-box domain-containing protein n=1 Tax=Exidia glandulosa HHB12029 TaxID=1314781 RepID=A0A165HWS9_EXIGL|nr:hypothetical protein EXIGLDRAFT_614223 [Exidia glandulosa HHB12029]
MATALLARSLPPALYDDLLCPLPLPVPPDSIPQLRQALCTLDSRIRSLADQKHLVESKLASAVALQSPIRRLPREILAKIFAVGVRELDDEDALFLSRLTLVCRYWHHTAVDTPELWAAVAVDHHNRLGNARRRLQRSKNVPLDISIDFSPRATPLRYNVADAVARAMDLLRPETRRWRTFRLRVPHRAAALAALARCTLPAPLLERFSVHAHMSFADSACPDALPTLQIPLFRGCLPRLRDVDLVSAPVQCDNGSALLRSLRTLRLVDLSGEYAPSVAQLLSVLRACPGLEELALRNMEDVVELPADFEAQHEGPVVCLPFLRVLTFSFCGVTRVGALLDRLSFPCVERIDFAHLENISSALQSISRQTRAPLHQACLFSELKLTRLLRRLPSISTLELVDCEDVSANILRGLSAPPPGIHNLWILPNLAKLVLDGCAGIEWEPLRALVEQRAAALFADGGAPLPLRALDVGRCPQQLSRERVQLLRMYVRDVHWAGWS